MARRVTALGMARERQMSGDVAWQWMTLLRRRCWLGPTFTAPPGYIVNARNNITELALQDGSWDDFLWVDSDMMFDVRLSERVDELTATRYWQQRDGGLIVGCYYDRRPPFECQLFTTDGNPDEHGIFFLRADEWLPRLAEAEQRYLHGQSADLFPVAGGGTGLMLIRRDVLERLAERKGTPRIWEARAPSEAMRAKFGKDGKPITMWTEDINFCLEVARDLGVQPMADSDLRFSAAHVGEDRVSHQHYKAAHMIFGDPTAVELPKGYELATPAGLASPPPAARS